MSLPTKNTLKFSYHGQERNILYDVFISYTDIMAVATKEFNISEERKHNLLIEDENGYLFDRVTFEYYIMLFPNPEIVFFLRLDGNSELKGQDVGYFQPNKERLLNTRDNEHNQRCSPLSRQNSFFGSPPPPSPLWDSCDFPKEDDSPKPLATRRKLIDSKKPSKKFLKPCDRRNTAEGTPIFRQDCFLGSLPGPYFNQHRQRSDKSKPVARKQSHNYVKG